MKGCNNRAECAHHAEIERLRLVVQERADVDMQLEARLEGIEKKLQSLTWRLAIIAGSIQAAAQFFEYFKR